MIDDGILLSRGSIYISMAVRARGCGKYFLCQVEAPRCVHTTSWTDAHDLWRRRSQLYAVARLELGC